MREMWKFENNQRAPQNDNASPLRRKSHEKRLGDSERTLKGEGTANVSKFECRVRAATDTVVVVRNERIGHNQRSNDSWCVFTEDTHTTTTSTTRYHWSRRQRRSLLRDSQPRRLLHLLRFQEAQIHVGGVADRPFGRRRVLGLEGRRQLIVADCVKDIADYHAVTRSVLVVVGQLKEERIKQPATIKKLRGKEEE